MRVMVTRKNGVIAEAKRAGVCIGVVEPEPG